VDKVYKSYAHYPHGYFLYNVVIYKSFQHDIHKLSTLSGYHKHNVDNLWITQIWCG